MTNDAPDLADAEDAPGSPWPSRLTLDFAGEVLTAEPGKELTVGRSGDLEIDDNPYLHRDFLCFRHQDGMWWVINVGARLAAYLTDAQGLMRSRLAPGARSPLVFPRTVVTFAAGETLYELLVDIPDTPYDPVTTRSSGSGATTIVPGQFTESQLLSILALAEPVLRRAGSGAGEIPTTQQAADRLGWTTKRFDKKIENVCDKLSAAGVRGLRGAGARMASNRRLHLVEYAVSTLLVTPEDLPLLDLPQRPVVGED
ncbi:hypothetical protein ACFQ0K_13510 [Nocardioides caeni]|uniref:FHA domain-containing protein n=1 Tax=Nocardioides caeni TaxID=574700 RepID=A0A4S8N4X9_9ACTN|nr:hypothetical protein [Nocardioides caeni]THV09949.1 hypothetical protein E9934_15665 [Nocardioides caeni]